MSSTPPPEGSTDQQEFVAPDNGGWHYTIMRDWIAVCPDISATAKELYWIIRSVMYEKGDRTRRLSLDELCWLLPGINGKTTSLDRVKNALRELDGIGLISNPDGDVQRRWVHDPKTGKQTRENYRRWQVHDYPADTDSYSGWRSAIAKLDAYPGPGWRETAKSTEGAKKPSQSRPAKTRKTPGRTEGAKKPSQSQADDQGRKHETPGHTESAFSPSKHEKKRDFEYVTRNDPTPNEVLQGSTNQPTKAGSDASAPAEPVGSGNAGWLDTESEQDEDGVRLLRSLPCGIGNVLSGKAIVEWSHVIGAALRSGMSEQTVIGKLTAGLPSTNRTQRVKIVVGHRLPDLQTSVEAAAQHEQSSPADAVHTKVDRMAERGQHGAREAAGLLGEHWDPEQYRGEAGSQEWLLEILPELSREFVEARRDELVSRLTSRTAA